MSESFLKLKFFVDGEWRESSTSSDVDCFDPSTGDVIAFAPQCTGAEVDAAVSRPRSVPPPPGRTPPASTRVQVLFRMKVRENGKVRKEAMGDVLKATEGIEFACGIPPLMKGPAYDKTSQLGPVVNGDRTSKKAWPL